MKKLLAAAFCLLIAFDCRAAGQEEKEFQSISIMATTSLTEVMSEIIENYARQKDLTVSAIYDSPAELERRIKEGERADIFISENPRWINDLKQLGVIDVYSISGIAGNRLALVADAEDKWTAPEQPTKILLEKLTSRLFVMVDYNTDPLGIYAKITLEKLGLFEKAKSMIVRAANSTNAIYLITKENTPGIVYYTDAYNNPEVKTLSTISEELSGRITYDAAVVAGDNMVDARAFLEYLKGPESQGLFRKYGFIVF